MTTELETSLKKAIEESGFPFENHVCMALKSHGWIIIPNRYYIDDLKGVEREIDILAYKYRHDDVENICYYTALIISCKKSSKYSWTFITRHQDENDSNINYFPFNYLTDDDRLIYMTNKNLSSFERTYKSSNKIKGFFEFTKSIVSYQEFDGSKFGQNQNIYNSLITTIKALESEKSILKERKKGANYHYYYSFNLLSLFDGEMKECLFGEDESVSCNDISYINYLNRHIVNNVESFYSVLFATKPILENVLDTYDALAKKNEQMFPVMISEFYNDIFKDDGKVQLFWNTFVNKTSHLLSYYVSQQINDDVEIEISTYKYSVETLSFDIYYNHNIDYSTESIYEMLNNSESINIYMRKNLEEIYRFKGNFSFESLLPF